jgi:K+-sensing histidine kinase KdpD
LGFTARLPNGPVPIQADNNALRRALLILIDNAVKYTPRKGSTFHVKLPLQLALYHRHLKVTATRNAS